MASASASSDTRPTTSIIISPWPAFTQAGPAVQEAKEIRF